MGSPITHFIISIELKSRLLIMSKPSILGYEIFPMTMQMLALQLSTHVQVRATLLDNVLQINVCNVEEHMTELKHTSIGTANTL